MSEILFLFMYSGILQEGMNKINGPIIWSITCSPLYSIFVYIWFIFDHIWRRKKLTVNYTAINGEPPPTMQSTSNYTLINVPLYLSIFDLIFRVFVSKRSAYCFVRKVLCVLSYSFSLFRTHVKLLLNIPFLLHICEKCSTFAARM